MHEGLIKRNSSICWRRRRTGIRRCTCCCSFICIISGQMCVCVCVYLCGLEALEWREAIRETDRRTDGRTDLSRIAGSIILSHEARARRLWNCVFWPPFCSHVRNSSNERINAAEIRYSSWGISSYESLESLCGVWVGLNLGWNDTIHVVHRCAFFSGGKKSLSN